MAFSCYKSKPSSAKYILFIGNIQFILAARPMFFFKFGRVETSIGYNGDGKRRQYHLDLALLFFENPKM